MYVLYKELVNICLKGSKSNNKVRGKKINVTRTNCIINRKLTALWIMINFYNATLNFMWESGVANLVFHIGLQLACQV